MTATTSIGPLWRSLSPWRPLPNRMTDSDDPAQLRSDTDAAPVEATTDRTADAALVDLLVKVAAGDDRAFAAVYDTVAARVFGLARRITRNPALAEEVTQDVMVEVWRTAPRFDQQRGSAVGWILMLTHRRSVDRVRRTSAQQARDLRDGAREPVQPPVDEDLLRADERREVRSALTQLTDLQRQAIELAYYEGRTYREVAQVLNVPEGTAKSRLRDGIRQLRVSLRGGG